MRHDKISFLSGVRESTITSWEGAVIEVKVLGCSFKDGEGFGIYESSVSYLMETSPCITYKISPDWDCTDPDDDSTLFYKWIVEREIDTRDDKSNVTLMEFTYNRCSMSDAKYREALELCKWDFKTNVPDQAAELMGVH